MLNNKKLKIKKALAVVLLLACFILTGCWSRHELKNLAILSVLGIDKNQSGQPFLTAQLIHAEGVKKTAGPKEGTTPTTFQNVFLTGDTLSEAVRSFQFSNSRLLFLGQTQAVILGPDVAQEGVRKYVDFLIRNHEFRRTTQVLVARGSAKEILETKGDTENIFGYYLARLVEQQTTTSQIKKVTFNNFLSRLLSKTTAPVAPYIELSPEGKIQLTGTAVFKGDKLVGELNKVETRGLLWVLNEVESGVILVNWPKDKKKMSMVIAKAGSKIQAQVQENKVSITIFIKEEGYIDDTASSMDFKNTSVIKELEYLKEEAIRQEVLAAWNKAKILKTDIFGFGDAVNRKHPQDWEKMEPKWDEIFPTIELNIVIETKLTNAGYITKSLSSQ